MVFLSEANVKEKSQLLNPLLNHLTIMPKIHLDIVRFSSRYTTIRVVIWSLQPRDPIMKITLLDVRRELLQLNSPIMNFQKNKQY